eukprot:15125947-Alexandrium_andersonii.AAC.1
MKEARKKFTTQKKPFAELMSACRSSLTELINASEIRQKQVASAKNPTPGKPVGRPKRGAGATVREGSILFELVPTLGTAVEVVAEGAARS